MLLAEGVKMTRSNRLKFRLYLIRTKLVLMSQENDYNDDNEITVKTASQKGIGRVYMRY